MNFRRIDPPEILKITGHDNLYLGKLALHFGEVLEGAKVIQTAELRIRFTHPSGGTFEDLEAALLAKAGPLLVQAAELTGQETVDGLRQRELQLDAEANAHSEAKFEAALSGKP